jgi:hypothetical protein
MEIMAVVEIVGKLGPLIVAGLVAYIGWRQWRTSHEKLKLDLHQKRFEIWEGLQAARTALELDGKLTDDARVQLVKACRETKFFFEGKRINELADQLWKEGWTAYTKWHSANRSTDPDRRMQRWEEYEAASAAFLVAHDEWTKLALKRMQIRH